MTAVLLDKENPIGRGVAGRIPRAPAARLHLGVVVTRAAGAELAAWRRAVIINSGPREYTIAGNGVIATFTPGPPPIAGVSGIERIEEGSFQNGKWIAGRRLNGDENHQGRHLRLPVGAFGIQRIWLYR